MVRTSMLLQYAQIHVTIRLFDYNQVTPKHELQITTINIHANSKLYIEPVIIV